MKKIILIGMLLLLCGCSNQQSDSIKQIYSDAFEHTFKSDYSYYSITSEANSDDQSISYAMYFIDDENINYICYTGNYTNDQINYGTITATVDGDYVKYVCESRNSTFSYLSTTSSLVTTKSNVFDYDQVEINTKRSSIIEDGVDLYYESAGNYVHMLVTIENNQIVKEEITTYEDKDYESLAYTNITYYESIDLSFDEEVAKARGHKGDSIEVLEEYLSRDDL